MEKYIETLLEQIRCKKAKEMIGKEIRNHIVDQTEDNMRHGMKKEEAMKAAVEDMGDPIETGISLDSIHRPHIAWSMVILMEIISIASIMLHIVIGLGNPELGMEYLKNHIISVICGFAVMLFVYRMDYSFMAKYGKAVAALFSIFLFVVVFFIGSEVNGAVAYLSFGGLGRVSIIDLAYLFIPIFGAVLYQYHGEGPRAIVKSMLWMIIPVFIASRIPCTSLMLILFFMMAILLSVAVWKKWFLINSKRFLLVLWSVIVILPIALIFLAVKFRWFADYQTARIQAFIRNEPSDYNYVSRLVTDLMEKSHFIGASSNELVGTLPSYNSDYIFTFLASYYGTITALVIAGILLFLIGKIFSISFRQKNQLGMMMGCGSGLVFLTMTLTNLLENVGFIPTMQTVLPFFSYGGTETIVSYILIGIVLSIYRYKNILPEKLEKGKVVKIF